MDYIKITVAIIAIIAVIALGNDFLKAFFKGSIDRSIMPSKTCNYLPTCNVSHTHLSSDI